MKYLSLNRPLVRLSCVGGGAGAGGVGLFSALRLGHWWCVRIGYCAAARILLVVLDTS